MAATLFLNNSRDLDLLLGYLHLPPKSIEISKKKKQGSFGIAGPSFQQDEVVVSGNVCVARQLVSFAKDLCPEAKNLTAANQLEKAKIQQWMLYCETHVKPSLEEFQEMQKRAEELNDHLRSHTFIAGNHLSLADLFTFQTIHQHMSMQSFQDKEKYIHLSRWFNNVQNTLKMRHKLPYVHFHRMELYK